MQRKTLFTEKAPPAIGAFSQAVRSGDLVFVSGQLGVDPVTKKMVDGGVEAQARQAIANLQAVLAAAGSSLDAAVKTTIYLADIGDFAVVNEVYAAAFTTTEYPARAAFAVGALPLGGLVEIEAVALVQDPSIT